MHISSHTLIPTYGWSDAQEVLFSPYTQLGYTPARIIREGRQLFLGISPGGKILLECSGAFHNLLDLGVQPQPIVGDWCAIRLHGDRKGLIEAILPRMNAFHKPLAHDASGIAGSQRAVASNIDFGVIIMDCKHDFNLHRIERFVSLLQADGIRPMLVLTKIDLVDDPAPFRNRVHSRLGEVPVFLVSSTGGCGMEPLSEALLPAKSYLLLGTSGAGKSTLINALAGRELAKAAQVRMQDGRGRHTTTARQMHLLANGTLLLDTPGIRVVGMHGTQQEVTRSFSDIEQIASGCKYADCTHTGEPGCAVHNALQEGLIEQDRYFNFLRLREEGKSWEAQRQLSERKKREIGRLQYLMRRDGKR